MFDFWNRKKKHVSPLGGSPFDQQLLELLVPHLLQRQGETGENVSLRVYHGPRLDWKYRFDIPIDPRDISTRKEWKAYQVEMLPVVDAESFEPYRENTLQLVQEGDDLPILTDMLCQAAAYRPGGVLPVAFGITRYGEGFGIPCIVLMW